jgi:hypothetical protein
MAVLTSAQEVPANKPNLAKEWLGVRELSPRKKKGLPMKDGPFHLVAALR